MASPSSTQNRVRHECKFVAPVIHLARIQTFLDHVCAVDPAFQTNIIKSLYYDTDRLDLLRQKQASEFKKRKVRVRWYVDPGSGEPGPQAFLEVKSKNGARGDKQRRQLPIAGPEFDRNPLAAAEQLHRLATDDPDLAEILHSLTPACVIQYQRRRYIEMGQGFRIALDAHIRASSLNHQLLRGRRECRPTVAILEIKGPEARELPRSLATLHRWGVKKAAFSKYAACLDGEYPIETNPL